MRSEPNFGMFCQAFSSRTKALIGIDGALDANSQSSQNLKEAITELDEIVSSVGDGEIEDQYRAFLAAIAIFAVLADWKSAIRRAESDAQRYLSSAKLQASEIDKSQSFTTDEKLLKFLAQVEGMTNVAELADIKNLLKQWSLPLFLFTNTQSQHFKKLRGIALDQAQEEEKENTTVAFLKFDIDGEPAKQWNYLKPGVSYDLTIEVRVSNWPQNARSLSLTPITVDVREKVWLPRFDFMRPDGESPFTFTGTGRADLAVAHSFGSRPYEFLYAAEFDDGDSTQDVEILGHRRLLLEGSDTASHPLTGFSNVDRHLLSIRNKLRNHPNIYQDDISSTMIILGGLGNIAAQALKAATFEANTSERQFQKEVAVMLRSRSDIGEELEDHLEAAGGITDLTFRSIPVELKVENSKAMSPKDFTKFFDQTAAYSIGLGKKIGVLAVLNSSLKLEPTGDIDNDIAVFFHETGNATVAIVVVVIRGGLPKPSSYSK